MPPSELDGPVLPPLSRLTLEWSERIELVPGDPEDGLINWGFAASVVADPEWDDLGWLEVPGATLEPAKPAYGSLLDAVIFRMTGFTLDLDRGPDPAAALDRDADAWEFASLFDTDGELVGPFGNTQRLVVVDRVQLASAWRGARVGSLLTVRSLRELIREDDLIGVYPHPFELDEREEPITPDALASVQRFWAAIGFVPVTSAPRLFTMGPGSGEIDLVLTLLEADLLGDGASD